MSAPHSTTERWGDGEMPRSMTTFTMNGPDSTQIVYRTRTATVATIALRCGRIKAAVRAMTCSALARSSLSSSSTPTAPHHPIRTSSPLVEDLRSRVALVLCGKGCGVLIRELGENLAIAEAVVD